MRTRLVLAALLLASLVVPASSSAAVHELGKGRTPDVGIDGNGTAYVAWAGNEALSNSLNVCRVPRGASACQVTKKLATSGNSVTPPFVQVSQNRVTVVQYRYPEKGGDMSGLYRWTSNDGGTSFDDGKRVGSISFTDAVFGPGDTLSGVTDAVTEGLQFQNVPLTGEASGDGYALLWKGSERPYRGAIGLIDGTTPLAIGANGSDEAAFRIYRGGAADLEKSEGWTAETPIGVFGYPHLAAGKSGLFALGGTADRMMAVREFDGTTFGDAVPLAAGDSPNSHLFQDEPGRLHAVWNQFAADGLHLVHAVSDDGRAWRHGTVVVQQVGEDGGIAHPRVAVAADHIGVVVWNAGTGESDIRLADVGPDAPKPVVQVSGSAGQQGNAVVISVTGNLNVPEELSKAEGCSGGKVRITVRRGKAKVLAKSVAVRVNCTYKLKAKVRKSKVKSAKKLKVQARFGGNDALASSSKTKTINVRK